MKRIKPVPLPNAKKVYADDRRIKEHDKFIAEIKKLTDENKKIKELLKKSMVACTHCPNQHGVCGEACSIKDIKIYME